ncbi:DoxX family protein [Dyadobacter fermentans]|nr:DoxX family protein [Dyadobacter fermentans]
MEATFVTQDTKPRTDKVAIIGKIISILCILFLLVDAVMKVIEHPLSMEGSVALGWPADQVQSIGIALLVSTILYIIPRTAILGAILITGYLGGAIAVMVMAKQSLSFAATLGVLVWAGMYLRDAQLRAMIPFRK